MIGFVIPTRAAHPHLERLVALFEQFGPVLVLDPSTRTGKSYASWVNQGIVWARAQGLTGLVVANDDIWPEVSAIESLRDGIAEGYTLVSQDRADNRWDFSADLFAIAIQDDQLWMDESFGFHWADLDMAHRARFEGRPHLLVPLEYDMHAWQPDEPKGHLSEFARWEARDVELRDARWGWLLYESVRHP